MTLSGAAGIGGPSDPTRKTMPESAGAGDSVILTRLPEWRPMPSSVTGRRIVCWRITARYRATGVPHSTTPPNRLKILPSTDGDHGSWCPARRLDNTLHTPDCLVYETWLDVHDDADLPCPISALDAGLVVGGSLHDRPELVSAGVHRLAVQQAVRERVRAGRQLDGLHHEALDLVHVEALVDPGHEQGLRRVGLRAHRAPLARLDLPREHEQREDAEGGLRERLGTRRAPAAHADVRLDLEVLPAGVGAHPRSPKRDWRIATSAGPAVSARRMRGPSETTMSPRARAASTSSPASPPSGPTTTSAARGAPASASTPASGAPPPSHAQRARSADSPASSQSASGRGGSTSGITARPDCLAASRATRCQRRARSRQRAGSRRTTVRAQSAGRTRATPSSVAARTIASIVSPFGTPWTSVTASGDGGTPAASASTVPVAVGPTVSSRTV